MKHNKHSTRRFRRTRREQNAETVVRAKEGMSTIVSRDKLNWRKIADGGYALHLGGSRKPLLSVLPDAACPGMWRVLHADRSSDMVNLSRAKDAAFSIALGLLNYRQETVGRPSSARLNTRPLVETCPHQAHPACTAHDDPTYGDAL